MCIDPADQYGKLIWLLEEAMALADDWEDGTTGCLIETGVGLANEGPAR